MHQLFVLVCVTRTRKEAFNAISACWVGVIVAALSFSVLLFCKGGVLSDRACVDSLAGKLLKFDIIFGWKV